MKNKYFMIAVILLIAGPVYTGCDNNRDSTQKNVEQANQDMLDEQAKYEKEWQQFKSNAELKITANQNKIDELKAAMKTTSANFKDKYENIILTFEQKNIELKKKLNEYQYEGKDSWEEFKKGFNHQVDTVAVALNDIFTKKE